MQLTQAVKNAFDQLKGIIEQLSPAQYTQVCKTLSGATIGQHTRHIIEMYQCLVNGHASGLVNYEGRKRDLRIETEKDFAIALMPEICAALTMPNKSLQLHAGYDAETNEQVQLDTNFWREIAYNLEHTIHHMALIKVGLIEVSDIKIPEGFGVASSTMKYRKTCAQ